MHQLNYQYNKCGKHGSVSLYGSLLWYSVFAYVLWSVSNVLSLKFKIVCSFVQLEHNINILIYIVWLSQISITNRQLAWLVIITLDESMLFLDTYA